ncbi:C45 family autoproteolytic acyltransferase/hydrolase [Halomonas beimenensis]|uniref:Peptidase C45 hydrolase domain-containing protein n=1 Tax=Halomonas beimenensis TaxID=475662 RepID=A0A291P5D1_9GAMM|nr:C45 family peptidase [Halomonas beimenensis]ATJ82068.1 hypothetical protein BEI_1081 [Halomonas beimenensis]
MHHLDIAGSPYAIGHAMGERGRTAFADRILPSADFRRLTPALANGWLTAVAARVRRHFPGVHEELRGLADGLAQPFEHVLLWNCRGDLSPTGPEGCSSVAVAQGDEAWLAHNEDGQPSLRDACFLLEARPDQGPAYLAFCYPGSLAGHTLGVNAAGLAYTVNNIRLTETREGIPRMVTARALLDCRDVGEALSLLRHTHRSGGFHFMMADTRHRTAWSVEAPWQGVSAPAVEDRAVHANHLVHPPFSSVAQRITDSSAARQRRLEAWRRTTSGAVSPEELLALLGDRSHPRLPLYRLAPDDPDDENTLATVLFRVTSRGVWVQLRPGPDRPPVLERWFG